MSSHTTDLLPRVTTGGVDSQLKTPVDQAQVTLCRKWIQTFGVKRKTANPDHSSYGLKHCVERWLITDPNADHYYVSNGAFITAAIEEGYTAYVGIGYTRNNPDFNISLRAWDTWLKWQENGAPTPSDVTLTVTNEEGELFIRGNGTYLYNVDLERCKTSAQVLDWVVQVSKKNWATPHLIGLLVVALDKELNLQANLCSRAILG